MSVKGSHTRVTKHDQFERNRVRAFTHTDGLLRELGDRIKNAGAPEEVTDEYRKALAMRSLLGMDAPDEKLARRHILEQLQRLDELEVDNG